jgi:RNA recognition motif-containing protein
MTMDIIVPNTTETIPDKDGIFTRTEYRLNDNNHIVKVVKTIRKTVEKVVINRNVEKRRNEWKPFGLAATTNNKVTFVSDELVFMEPINKKEENKCKACGKDHLRNECTLFKINRFSEYKNEENEENEEKVYNKKEKIIKEEIKEKLENTILIKNLSKNINEQDLQYTCIILGLEVKDISIINSRTENCNFGYIAFNKKSDAEKYKNLMDNYGYDYLRFDINIL